MQIENVGIGCYTAKSPPWLFKWAKEIEMEGLIEGRIVHYVLDRGPSKGQHRPAIVVRVWRVLPDNKPPENGCCQLQVFTDGSNDDLPSVMWATSVTYDEAGTPRSWHWPEKTGKE